MMLEIEIALRFLRSKRKEAFISIVTGFSLIGIALGVAILIIVMSVMNGYHREFMKNILGMQGHLTVASHSGRITGYNELADKIEKIKGVEIANPVIIEQGMFLSKEKAAGGFVRAIAPDKLILKPLIRETISTASISAFERGDGILMGVSLARSLRVSIGDYVKVIAPELSSTMVGSIPRSKSFKIVGLFDVGLYQYNSSTVFMTLSDAQAMYRFQNAVSEIEIVAANIEDVNIIKMEVAGIMSSGMDVVDWEQAQDKWLNALKVERNVMFLILTLIVCVAAFNIVSGLIMLVKDKAKSIAILRTMGMRASSVVRVFVICGSVIGVVGSCTGVVIGSLIAYNIESLRQFLQSLSGVNMFDPVVYFLTHLPSEVRVSNILFVLLISICFSLIATIYPAYRAARLQPTKILRYE